mmetsp:Transcript_36309/g.102312  ORF Transcript_36309/g.102312 Transcript_36309/m.102312 type:complete len:166 (+) Transcript_36309:2-499(+)
MGCFWIYVLTTEIVAVCRALARIWGTSEVIFGLTVLAWGHSLIDLVTNTRIARQGFKNMAVSACFGASTFTLLFGMGVSITITILVTGATYEHVHIPATFALSFLAVVLVLTLMLVVVPLQRFWITNSFVFVLLLIYAIYGICVILTEFQVIPVRIPLPQGQCSS